MARVLLFLTVILLSSSLIYSQKFLGEKMDIFKCISDVSALKTEIQSFLAQNITVEALINEIGTIEPMVVSALSDCGVANVTLPSLLSQKSEQVPISFDFLNCLSDLNTLVTLVTQLSTDVTTGNIFNILQDLTSLRTDFVALLSDCAVNNSAKVGKGRVLAERSVNGALDCLSDINDKLVPDVQTFLNVTKSGQIADIIAILNVLVNDINTTLADCQLGSIARMDTLVARLNSISPIDCLSDVSTLVNLAETILQNVENSQYEELISNLEQFVSSIEQTIQDCTGSNSTLTIKFNVDILQCISDVETLVDNVNALVEAAKAGNYSQALEIAEAITGELNPLLVDCGVNNATIQKFNRNVFLGINPIACLEDLANVVSIANQTLADAEAYDVISVVSDVESLVSVVQNAIADCTGSNSTKTESVSIDILECINDVETLVLNVQELINAVEVGNYSEILPLVEAITDEINPLLADCGVNATIAKFNKKFLAGINPIACLEDLESLVSIANQTLADAEAYDVISVVSDVESLVSVVETALADCTGSNMTKAIEVTTDIQQCVQDVEILINGVNDLLNALRLSNYSAILPLIEAITQDINPLTVDCGLNSTFTQFNNKIFFIGFNPIACLEDLETLISIANQTLADAEAYNVISVVSDVESLVSAVETAISDCTGSNMTKTEAVTMDIMECINDVEIIVGNVNELLNAVKIGNYSEILPLVETIIDDVNPLLSDCGLNASIGKFDRKFNFNLEQCIDDLGSVVQIVTDIALDIQSQDFTQLIQDVETALQTLQQLGADCLGLNLTSSVRGECFEDVIGVVNDVVSVVQKIGNMSGSLEEIMEIIDQVSGIVNEVENLENDCGFNLTLIKNHGNVIFLALGQQAPANTCWGSVMNLGKALLDIVSGTDMMAKFGQIMQIKSLVDEVKSACLGQSEIKKPESIVSYVTAKGLRL